MNVHRSVLNNYKKNAENMRNEKIQQNDKVVINKNHNRERRTVINQFELIIF